MIYYDKSFPSSFQTIYTKPFLSFIQIYIFYISNLFCPIMLHYFQLINIRLFMYSILDSNTAPYFVSKIENFHHEPNIINIFSEEYTFVCQPILLLLLLLSLSLLLLSLILLLLLLSLSFLYGQIFILLNNLSRKCMGMCIGKCTYIYVCRCILF